MLRNNNRNHAIKQPKPRKRQTPKRLALTPEIQALYFQCLAGKLHQLSGDEQRIILQVFNQQFPTLRREALRVQSQKNQSSFFQNFVNWILYMVLLIFGVLIVLVVLEYYARADESPYRTILHAAQQQADDATLQSWKQGTEDTIQPVVKTVGRDGTVVLAQNNPRVLEIKPNGELGLNDRHTTITVIQPTPPPPVNVPQQTRIQTVVNGIDQIETRAMLPEHLVVDQLEAVKKIADNGTLIAQQRFALAQYQLNQDASLEYLRIVKSFVLWGFLASIPFLLTGYWITQRMLTSIKSLTQQRLNFQLKKLESEERQLSLAMSDKQGEKS